MDIEMQSGDRLFEWDENKNKKNLRKHGINFETAVLVFEDENRKEIYDWKHSRDEDRYKVIGMVEDILCVIYTERGDKTRIISAREASSTDRRRYYGNSDIRFT